MSPSNPHEEARRATKAFKLTATLLRHGVTVDEARGFDIPQWEIVARAANVNPPSPATVALVLQWLDD